MDYLSQQFVALLPTDQLRCILTSRLIRRLWEPGDGWGRVFFFVFFTEAAADFIIVTESALIIWFLHVHIKVSPAQERNTYTQLVNSEHAAYSRCAVSNKAIDIFFDHWDCLPLRNTGERIKMTVCFSVYQLDNACVVCGCQSVVWIG